MNKKPRLAIQRFVKSLLVVGLILCLAFNHADAAWAARSGGRIGGGSFRTPSRTYAAPSRGYQPSGGFYGGGFGFPFLIPFFGFGGGFGGLFSIFIVIALANFVVNAFRRAQSEEGGYTPTSQVSVAQVQVGLLAQARSLQTDLERMARTADTGTASGRAQVLQEATLALLRHPEYWMYGSAQSQQIGLDAAEAKFNQWAITERSKFTEETLSNVENQLRGTQAGTLPTSEIQRQSTDGAPGEYIVVTLVVGSQGKIQLPRINNSNDLRQAISQIGSVSGDQLLAVEILWTPQASGDTLSGDDMVAYYPDLKLI